MGDRDLEEGTKEPGSVSGAPYPPATRHSDGPERPPRHVPTADPQPEEEDVEDVSLPTHLQSEEDQDDGDS